ncbi:Sensory box histidine kinase [Rhodovulum sp. PH10]|uniref:sensor histidine kinase n=1 Tax=Rhodovulum sp. PH10 TaxID=1187851 RepID=UPI00027C2BAA|nr:CHASE3 domain-containing protein [Rhodovulum sp. PH10]EJW10568.1 Sensory box histidine kinase [Rhodovulum sp. PH10]
MPLSKIALIRTTAAAFIVGLAALLAIVATTVWLVGETQTYTELSIQVRQQRAALVDLRSLMQDAETGQRGYMLTGDEDYLAPYDEATGRIATRVVDIRRMLAGDPDRGRPFDQLAELVAAKVAEMQQTVALYRAGRRDEALAMVRTGRGRELMDEARDLFDQLIDATEQRIYTHVSDQQKTITALFWTTLLGALVIVVVVAGAAWAIVAYTRQLVTAQREVEVLNAGLEERVAERTAELGRANEEIQRFAYIVTHDLRAPLVNIMGFTSELETSLATIRDYMETVEGGDDVATADAKVAAVEDAPEAIGFIRSSTRKMDGLINAILKLSREGRRTLKPEPIDLRQLLETAVANVQHQVAEAGGEVTIEGVAPPMVSDRLALEQIFGNLLDNAVKYRHPVRPLEITLRTRQEPAQRVVVEVSDNGRGIAPQDHERVFDLFRRSGAQDQPGEGIGLAHVRAMVRNLGGEITLVSALDEGTTMRIVLPRNLRKLIGAENREPKRQAGPDRDDRGR